MQTSIFLAQLIGPVLVVAAIGLLLNAAVFRAMSEEILRNRPLLFISGVLTMTAGLAIVLNHNVWAADWRVILTVFGWAATVGGASRIVLPQQVKRVGEAMLDRTSWVAHAGGVVWLIFGLVLCYFGYVA